MEKNTKQKSPWAWIPTLYFAQGLPYVVAMTVAVIMYKKLGVSNADIALYTSWLYLPWVIKPFWSPFVDLIKTKRWWIITMQLLVGAGLAGVAFLIPMPFYFQATLAVLWLIAFSSATYDIAADGFYMLALDSSQQSFFVGIRSTFYRLAMITGQGLLIIIAGGLETWTGAEPLKINVSSSNSNQTELILEEVNHDVNLTDELTFVAFPENLILNTTNISPDSLKRIKSFVDEKNLENGFVVVDEKADKTKEEKKTWWTNYVSKPLGDYLKTNFGEKRELAQADDGNVGNAGIVAIRLSKKPEDGKSVVLNSSLKNGDKSISIVGGERIVFTSNNWDRPAYMLIQLDHKLQNEVIAEFHGLSGNIKLAWSITFFILSGFVLLIMIYHRFVLPKPASDVTSNATSASEIMKEFGRTFATFFEKPGIITALAFFLLYRLGEALLVKMSSPFLLDAKEIGGLGLTTGEVGIVYGTVGIIALTLGGILGGIAASRRGLKYFIWPMALAITLPNLTYLYLSGYQPDNFFLINVAVAVEQFGYGFGFTAYMLYMIYFADGEHKTAHFAISTGLMALGMMLPGMMAGWLQEQIGYVNFFVFVILCAIPTLAVIPFLKIDKDFGKK